MFFWKRHIEFADLTPFYQLESALIKYIKPKLSELGFKMSKDIEFKQIYFTKEVGQFKQSICFNISDNSTSPGGALFETEWSIYSDIYEKWHQKHFGNLLMPNELATWFDSHKKIDNKYCKITYGRLKKEYDLGRYTTKKLMLHLLKQTIKIRIPMLESYLDWNKLAEWNSESFSHLNIDKIFDCYILANNFKKAASTLKQHEDYLKINIEFYDHRVKMINLRKNFLKKHYQSNNL